MATKNMHKSAKQVLLARLNAGENHITLIAIGRVALLATLLMVLAICDSVAQTKTSSAYQTYINQYKDLAIEQMKRYNIPASITLAQGLLESAAGQSELSRRSNNHFGIKCHDWKGRKTYYDDDARDECFRVYDNVRQSYEDHSRFLVSHSRYSRLFHLSPTDYKGWARGLKECGYATNPRYADKLIEIIELYKLYKLDNAKSFDKFIAYHASTDKPATKNGQLHPIYKYNDNYYIIVREGDTFKTIGKEVKISYRKIAKYNERDKNDYLVTGERIYLKKKAKKAEKQFKKQPHVVKSGESMYSIAQLYGIRLKSLYKKNHLSPDYDITVGDVLIVY